jgi:iron complex outermembrane receptor protein
MLMKQLLVGIGIICCVQLQAQDTLPAKNTDTLQQVTVTAFANTLKWQEAPVAVATLDKNKLQELDARSLVPLMNSVPGVRMEQRSPGSYRLAIRGSVLRSPFGVRDVKIYWNDVMLTDAGGNSYLNLIDLNQLQSVELIKGPASSMYGANTGGAVILHSADKMNAGNAFNASVTGGSYNLFNEQTGWQYQNKTFNTSVQQSHDQSDSYRQQSAMRRDVVKWDGNWQINAKEKLSFLNFYANLYYQTPGGLTQHQMDSLPSQARTIAIKQKAAIYNETYFTGITLQSVINSRLVNTTTATINHTSYKNPFTINYEKRDELNYGGRTSLDYLLANKGLKLHWVSGVEWQQNHSFVDSSGNNAGVPVGNTVRDEIYVTQYYLFTQFNASIGDKWHIQAGLSDNKQLLKYRRVSDVPVASFQNINTNFLLAPRISVAYTIYKNISLYGIVAKGFSPPTIQEVHPSAGGFYDLQPEYGWNTEAGIKGSAWHNRLLFDAAVYSFRLQDAIVERYNDAGQEYFINAGSTKQNGVELWVQANLLHNANKLVSNIDISSSFAYQPYKFDTYTYDDKNYSGNKLPGVPETVAVTGLNIESKYHFYLNGLLNCTSALTLDDANDAHAKAYQLLQAKLGYKKQFHHTIIDVFVGADNIFNQVYSLGNDINAAGNRFFNPAAARNYYGGVKVSF